MANKYMHEDNHHPDEKRDDSISARFKDFGKSIMGDEDAHSRMAEREARSLGFSEEHIKENPPYEKRNG